MTNMGLKLTGQNISFVYRELDLNQIDNREIKRIFDGEVITTEIPVLYAYVWPAQQTIIHIGDRRIRITHQKETDDTINLWDPANKLHEITHGKDFIAYGFNYDIKINLNVPGSNIIKSMFENDLPRISGIIRGDIENFIPRVIYTRENATFDFIIQTIGEKELSAHLNVHYDKAEFPALKDLKANYQSNFQYLRGLVLEISGE